MRIQTWSGQVTSRLVSGVGIAPTQKLFAAAMMHLTIGVHKEEKARISAKMVARHPFNDTVRFVDHYPFVGVGVANEPRSSHAHDIWRACYQRFTTHPPNMDWMHWRLYTASKSTSNCYT